MPPGFHPNLATEIIYSLVVLIACLLIYFEVSKLYKLTDYKGIRYFQNTFLFFAIAYFFRFLSKPVVRSLFGIRMYYFNILILLVFVYASCVAVFYLIYSLVWKRLGGLWVEVLIHIISVVIALAVLLTGNIWIFIIVNLALLIYAFIAVNLQRKNKKFKMYLIYLLIVVFSILNLVDILVPNFLFGLQLWIYIFSVVLFMFLLYKVLKEVK